MKKLTRRHFVKLASTVVTMAYSGVSGIQGRSIESPQHDDLGISSSAGMAGEVPRKIRIDALEAGSWNGIAFIVDDQASFQVRVGTQAEFGDYIDGDNPPDFLTTNFRHSVGGRKPGQWATFFRLAPLYYAVKEVGPHAPDGSYCRVTWDPLYPYDTGSRISLEWSRLDDSTVLGKVTYTAPYGQIDYNAGNRVADVVLEAYSPWGESRGMAGASYQLTQDGIFGSSEYHPVIGESEWDRWHFSFSSPDPHLPPEADPGRVRGFSNPDLDDKEWKLVRWGSYWQEDPWIDRPGYGWYRHHVFVPNEWKNKTLRFDIGKIAESDWTFLNGILIGSESNKEVARSYVVKPGDSAYARILWGRENLLAVQVNSTGKLGGISSGEVLPGGAGHSNPPPRPRVLALDESSRRIGFAVVGSRAVSSSGTYDSLDGVQRHMQQDGKLSKSEGVRYAALHFADLHEETKKRPTDNYLHFLALVGKDSTDLPFQAKQKLLSLDPEKLLIARRRSYEEKRVRTVGEIAGAAEMAANTLHWTVLYAPEQKRTFVVDSRRWFIPNRWALFGNSAVMSAWSAALESQELAQNTLIGILQEQLPNGMVPNAGGNLFSTPGRSQDMFAAYSAWKIYTKYPDRKFLEVVYPRIKAWHDWWFSDRGDGQPRRDGNRNGLLEIGSDAVPPGRPQDPPDSETYGDFAQSAYWESFDDSPMYSNCPKGPAVHPARYDREPGVKFLYRTRTLNLDLVHVNAYYALNAECLARIADTLGYGADAERFRAQYAKLKSLMNRDLWDERTGLYLNRLWASAGGKLSYRKTPGHFWVLAAGIPDRRQATRMVEEHLLNNDEFWGEFVLPSISRDDPAFAEQYYWRGTVWVPMNYFVYEGLKRYGFDDVAGELAKKSYSLVKANWERDGGLFENYNALNGMGDPGGAQSTIHYSWSAALPLISVMEFIDLEAWGGLRFGSLAPKDQARVENIEIAGDRYSVQAGPHTELWRNGVHLFEAKEQVVVRDFHLSQQKVAFRIKTKVTTGLVPVTLRNLKPYASAAKLTIDGQSSRRVQVLQGQVDFEVAGGEHSVEILMG